MRDREEGLHRLKTGDTAGWLNGVARVCVNLPERLRSAMAGASKKRSRLFPVLRSSGLT